MEQKQMSEPVSFEPVIKLKHLLLRPFNWDFSSYYKSIWIFMTILITWHYDEFWYETRPPSCPIQDFSICWRPGGE
jgi:hypothetical protein